MDSFSQILLRIPTVVSASSMSSWFGDASPFKVQVNIDIPLFEGNIDADALDNWLNILERYFFVHNFFDREKITFRLLKVVPLVQNWWGTYCEKNSSYDSGMFETNPTWASFIDAIREQYILLKNLMTSTQNGPFCIKKGTRWCRSTPTTFIPFAQS